MFSSCDALPYHWNPTSMAERVGLPLCNGSPTLNIFTHRFSVPPISPVSKSRGDGGVAKRQVEMRLTDHLSRGLFTKNQQKKLLVADLFSLHIWRRIRRILTPNTQIRILEPQYAFRHFAGTLFRNTRYFVCCRLLTNLMHHTRKKA